MEHQLLKRLETSLRLVGAQGRETVRTGPFELFVSASENPYLSFATPHADVPDWSGAVRALGEVFAERGRWARLEYLHELHLTLAPALEATGFKRESAAPVMTLTPDALAGPPALRLPHPTSACGPTSRGRCGAFLRGRTQLKASWARGARSPGCLT